MKVIAVLFAIIAAATAFAPAFNGRTTTSLAAKTPFFESVFDMDLFAPDPKVNDYGARNRKGLKAAKLGKNSYVPAGLTAAQYQKIRDQDEAKKNSNYQGYASKAFKFITLDTFTKAREVSKGDSIVKDVTRGHTMAKLKYDYESGKQYDGSA